MAQRQRKCKTGAAMEKGHGSLSTPGDRGRKESNVEDSSNEVEEQVSDLFGKLNLTTREKETLVLQDNEDSDLAMVKHAVIGNVLSPNLLHLQTIMSAMRPAWGNPRGLR